MGREGIVKGGSLWAGRVGPQGGPEGWRRPKISLFFSPSPAAKFLLFFPFWVSSRGILMVFEASDA